MIESFIDTRINDISLAVFRGDDEVVEQVKPDIKHTSQGPRKKREEMTKHRFHRL